MRLLYMLLLLVPFFKPSYVLQFSMINKLYNISQIVVTAFILVKLINKNKISKNICIIFILYIILIVSSYINNLNMVDCIKNMIQTFSLCIIIETLMREEKRKLIRTLCVILDSLILIDFIFILKYPNGIRIGLYDSWFLGAKNSHIIYILPAIFCNYFDCFIMNKHKKKMKYIFLVILFISLYIVIAVRSVTSIVVLCLFIIMIVFSNNKTYANVSLRLFTIVYALLFVGIVFFQIQNNFSVIFENVFKKDITFNGRTTIWENTIDYIEKSPLIGYGMEPSDKRVEKLGYISALHSHNMILEILYQGGIVGGVIFVIFWLRLCKKVDNYSNKNSQILKSIMIVYCVELFTEVFAFENLLWFFICIYELCDLRKELEE